METLRTDVVVVGLGAFGSATLWRLAARGADVVGIERQAVGHAFGSSHGTTRLFRIACMEHPGLPPIAQKSLELWNTLGADTGQVLVEQTGSLNAGPPGSVPVVGTREAAAAAGIPVVELDHAELVARQPQYAGLGPDDVGVWDPGAGICYPEPIVQSQVAAARRLGAQVFEHTFVTSVEIERDGVLVRTPTVEIRAQQVVVAAGAWLGKLVPGLPLAPRRTPLYWFQPRDPASAEFTLERFPSFIWQRPTGAGFWGHGSGDGFGVKLGLEYDGRVAGTPVQDADEVDRYIHPRDDVEEIAAAVSEGFPGLDPVPVKLMPCMVTDSPDGQFLIGRPDDGGRLVVAGGDSGHGFKHAGGLGELLAQLTLGEKTYCDTAFLDPRRYAN
ncbi:FAD dependent oxidoreductase [Kribbella flavida DSM 17836]|uniref:FAD dependent oxidoreductase n=1 Tax=Kribbella flavida (strain DSM 17836 / JCM 10339 / NBRC 14399) TaxID=479435 RepID=D2PKR5_KRIFD|nr:N-methyl-L-tryptophan oxidase [Kribbella flavida]ADB32382.1 FAD dependent oxidoreductase [Kribbella flavida DSM 17836]